MIAWDQIDTLLLDMDGTLLDLHYDNHFWLEHVPRRYAEARGLGYEAARDELLGRYKKVEGTLDWYCVDYWTRELGLDIPLLKQEVDHLIAIHPHVLDFLRAVRSIKKRTLLVTNAHGKAIDLKFRRTQLGGHFDSVVCSHDLRVPKERAGFWHKLQAAHPFDQARALLIDDSLAVLRAAREHGIGHLLAIRKPDSKLPEKDVGEFRSIRSFQEIMP
ncbi:MAG: GMP/IMP nucleotidase [Pseudomonadota bacterium]|nr:MAG: GMP/IMP nucleotidase [Pseudomonadota bacterium]